MYLKYLFLFILSFIFLTINAQNVRINEIASSNYLFLDEDNDTPDWIELYNFGDSTINLKGWSITDEKNIPNKWVFPDLLLHANEYLFVWCSGKDRVELGFPRTLISINDSVKYIIPVSEPLSSWNTINYDDSSWLS
ncbi:MAG: lamin tail domain-containing protein, partial [Cyclobacteriaceae bacterium]|nr:lamin tail domain-containing protein [Cyclobacteriaceae bacterium]